MADKSDVKTLQQKLVEVQSAIVAPKSQFNKFGNFFYRKCEDILEAVKPLLKEQGLALILFDELVQIGDRYYVKAVAELTDGTEKVSVQAYAREGETKKGMDESQITGASSSYARKYALNGLFCIDDVKDADGVNGHANGDSKANSAHLNGVSNGNGKNPVEKVKEKVMDKKPSECFECSNCGRVLTKKVHDFSVDRYKSPLCFDCQKELVK